MFNKFSLVFAITVLILSGCVQLESSDANAAPPAPADTGLVDVNIGTTDADGNAPDSNTPGDENAPVLSVIDQIVDNSGALKTPEEKLQMCEEKADQERDDCIKAWSLENNNKEACANIADAETKDKCYNSYALKSADIENCNSIQDETLNSNCVQAVVLNGKDWENCGKITSAQNKEACYKKASVDTSDAKYCALMSDVSEKNLCYKNYSTKTSECALITDVDDKQLCDDRVILENPTLENCQILTDEAEKQECNTRAAGAVGDLTICKAIEDKDSQKSCYTNTIELFDGNIPEQTCNTIQFVSIRNTCYGKIGLLSNSETACQQITDANASQTCYRDIAVATSNSETCANVTHYVKMREDCYYDIATMDKQPIACEGVDSDIVKYLTCYRLTALALEDIEVCNQIDQYTLVAAYSSYPLPALCMNYYAQEKNDLILCDKITSTPVRDACKTGNKNFK